MKLRKSSRYARRPHRDAWKSNPPVPERKVAFLPDAMDEERLRIILSEELDTRALFGLYDENLDLLEEALAIAVSARGNVVVAHGALPQLQVLERILHSLERIALQGRSIGREEVLSAVNHFSRDTEEEEEAKGESFERSVLEYIPLHRGRVRPRNARQLNYIEQIKKHDLCFAIGPAGTGKTYLAVALACLAIQENTVDRIILTRPAVEAGERLGFLPGDMAEKVDPYMRPLYDALYEFLGVDRVLRHLDRGTIEIAPLAFMRGRTLNSAFVILDEAQNATAEQMKMFLTRLGNNSRAVITGDVTQVDLPSDKPSGLLQARDILQGIEGIAFVEFTRHDVVRHPLVESIIDAYERFTQRNKTPQPEPKE
jgi:phosphate starvation-inducible protein PhoH and related proteins